MGGKTTVTDFSKLTGDFKSLSVTDLKVLALTYMIEVQKNGLKNIKTAPTPVSKIVI